MSPSCPVRSGVFNDVMMPPYVMARNSMPCALATVNMSMCCPSTSVLVAARVTEAVLRAAPDWAAGRAAASAAAQPSRTKRALMVMRAIVSDYHARAIIT